MEKQDKEFTEYINRTIDIASASPFKPKSESKFTKFKRKIAEFLPTVSRLTEEELEVIEVYNMCKQNSIVSALSDKEKTKKEQLILHLQLLGINLFKNRKLNVANKLKNKLGKIFPSFLSDNDAASLLVVQLFLDNIMYPSFFRKKSYIKSFFNFFTRNRISEKREVFLINRWLNNFNTPYELGRIVCGSTIYIENREMLLNMISSKYFCNTTIKSKSDVSKHIDTTKNILYDQNGEFKFFKNLIKANHMIAFLVVFYLTFCEEKMPQQTERRVFTIDTKELTLAESEAFVKNAIKNAVDKK